MSDVIHNGPRTLTYCLNQVNWCSVMTAVSKFSRQDSANAVFRSKLEKSIIQPQLTFCSYFFIHPACCKEQESKQFLGLANHAPARWANQQSDAFLTLLKRQDVSGTVMCATMCDNNILLQKTLDTDLADLRPSEVGCEVICQHVPSDAHTQHPRGDLNRGSRNVDIRSHERLV